MSKVKTNIVANYLGQGWASLMSLAFVPLYIKYLGIEAYGLIGFFAIMQAWLPLIDMGMTPTLNREMARFTAGAHSPESIRDLLRSLEIVSFSVAGFISIGIWLASGYLATSWVKNRQLSDDVIAHALVIFAVVLALRFCNSIYRGSLLGLQRQVWYNSANAGLATIRSGGAVCLLAWISPTVHAFFTWQAIISLVELIVFLISVYSILPKANRSAKPSRKALEDVWQFAGGMLGITLLALLLTQVDKLLLTRLLQLDKFGYYALASAIAGALLMIVGPVTQSVYPRMVELITRKQTSELALIYHQGAQLVTVLTVPVMLLLSIFAEGFVFTWTGDVGLAKHAAPILGVLVIGTFLNGMMHIPYLLQIAHGWTSLTIKVNAVAVLILVPAIFWVVPLFGAVGAAWVWVVLNSGYILFEIQLMHRRLLPDQKWNWYLFDLLLPIAGAIATVLLAGIIGPKDYQSRLHWLSFLVLSGSASFAIAVLMANHLRDGLFAALRNFKLFLISYPKNPGRFGRTGENKKVQL